MKFLSSEKLSTHKFKTPEGYLICTDAILARTGKQTYRRNEVFTDSDDDSEIEIDRKAEEVFSPATLASFENKPITVEHPDENVGPDNYNTLSVGFVRDVRRGNVDGQEVMLGTLVITDAKTIEEIENGEHVELSCGYDCDIIDEKNPQQRNIRGNHVALCECGRAGIARIVDSVKDSITTYKGYIFDIQDKDYPTFYGFYNNKAIEKLRGYRLGITYVKNGYHSDLYYTIPNDAEPFTIVIEPGKISIKKLSKYSQANPIIIKAAKDIENTNNIIFDSIEKEEKFDINKKNEELKENFKEFKEERMKDTNVKKVTELKRGDKIKLSSGSKAEVINVDLYPSIGEAYVKVKELIEGMQNKGQKEIEYNMHVDINRRYEMVDSIIDNLEYKINGYNSYTGRYFVEYIDANSVKEAIKKYAKYIAISGEGLANINIHSISPNDGYMKLYGKLNELLKTLGISVYDSKSCNDTKYGVIAKYKYLRGDTKGARIENDVDYANQLKQELENNDRIPYIVFEIKDSVKDTQLINYEGKDVIIAKNENEVLEDKEVLRDIEYQGKKYIEFKGKQTGKYYFIPWGKFNDANNIFLVKYLGKDGKEHIWKTYVENKQKAVEKFELANHKLGLSKDDIISISDSVKDDKEEAKSTLLKLKNKLIEINNNLSKIEFPEKSSMGRIYLKEKENLKERINNLEEYLKDSIKDSIKDSLIGKRVKTVYGDGEVIDELYKAGLKQWRVKLDSGSFVDTTRVEYNGTLYTDSIKDVKYFIRQYNGKWYYEDDERGHLIGPYSTEEEARFYFKKHKPTETLQDVDPKEGESKEDFISRFMSETKEEYPDEKQRLVVAYSYWKKKHTNDSKKYTVTYVDNCTTYIHTVKAKSALDAVKKIKK